VAVTVPAGLEAVLDADPELAAQLRGALSVVEGRLRAVADSSHPLLHVTAVHLLAAGGKRVRPLLALLAAHLGEPEAPGVVDAAVVVELTHLATLYHDDVMDEAELRRGAPSANSRWTNSTAILTGDYLFARASSVVADLGPEAVRIQARTFARLVQGQISETAGPADGEDAVAHHLQVLADKTASLFAASGRLGALVAGASPEAVDAVARFGEVYGVAFQLSDDLIDIQSERAALGKTPGTDLREGVRTLPVLLALADDDPAGERLRSLVCRPLPDDAEHDEALRLLRASPALAAARTRLDQQVEQARQSAASLPPGAARDALLGLVDALLARTG